MIGTFVAQLLGAILAIAVFILFIGLLRRVFVA
jgi:hypothetical protein